MQESTPEPHRSNPNAAALVWDWRGRAARKAGADAREAAGARKRGLIGLGVGLAVASLIYFFLHQPRLALAVAGIAALLALLALVSPLKLYRQATRALDVFAHGVGAGVTWILMTLLYFLLFLPVGLLLRAGRKLGIAKHYDPKLGSYWKEPKTRPETLDAYRRQF